METQSLIVGAGIDYPVQYEERANPLENPNIPLSDAEAMYEAFGLGGDTDSGVPVTPLTSLRYSPVWSCVDQISGDAARLPLNLWRRVGEEREAARNHAAYMLVRRRANPRLSAYHFWRQILADALLYPGGWAWIDGGAEGRVDGLYPMLPDRTYYDDDREMVLTEVGGRIVARLPEEVLHIRGLCTSYGECDPIDNYRNAISLGLAAEKFSSRFFKHGTKAGGILELPLGMSKRARDTVEEGFRKTHEGQDAWFKTVILRDGAKFHQTMINAREAQTTELREDQVRDVARFYKMPPSRLGLSDSVSYNSKTEDNQSYLDSCLSGWLETIVAECFMKLLSRTEQDSDLLYFEHNTAALLSMNMLQRSQVYHNAILDGWMSRGEVRRRENMPAAEGLDAFFQPANMVISGAAPADRQHAFRRVVFAMGDAARKRAQKTESLKQWIDGGLSRHRKHYRELVGDGGETEYFAGVIRQLRAAIDTDNPAESVEKIMTYLESQA